MQVIGGIMAVLALVVGAGAGMAVQRKRHAVKAHVTARDAVPGLKRTARNARFHQFLWLVGVGLFLVILATLVRASSG